MKELIRYNVIRVSVIASATGFNSAAQMSVQFKQLTGMTPSRFKKLAGERRIGPGRDDRDRDRGTAR